MYMYKYMYMYKIVQATEFCQCTCMPAVYTVCYYSVFAFLYHVSNQIADFGLSRDLADENYYVSKGGAIPVKWTAPEAVLYKKYSTASDVWSYGCLMYEIWSVGRKPFEGCDNIQVQNPV